MRICFVMAYPGYLRYFDSTVAELARRGHDVDIWFELPQKQSEGLEALVGADAKVKVRGRLPSRSSRLWTETALSFRRLTDYVRYLDPVFADAVYLRTRVGARLPFPFKSLAQVSTVGRRRARVLLKALLVVEQVIPLAAEFNDFLAESRPDVVVVTPLIMVGSRQADLVASARAAGIPSVVGVASWDHLTTKGTLRVIPDRVLVWNETQREEAERLHFVPRDQVIVTGAQPFDRWFAREPSTTREEFCERVGLPTDAPFVLFVGSTASISQPAAERVFVEEWIDRIRASGERSLHNLGLLVRPHPYNSEHWREADLSHLGASVWPRADANPVDEGDRSEYFDSLYHAAAVVGINTSAMIEAAIVGRPVFTITSPEFSATQTGTLHFHYLMPENGGFVTGATSLDEHVLQLRDALEDDGAIAPRSRAFVQDFIRPQGLEQPSTPLVATAIEELAGTRPEPRSASPLLRPAGRIGLLAFLLLFFLDPRNRTTTALVFRGNIKSGSLRIQRVGDRFEQSAGRLAKHLVARSDSTALERPTSVAAAGVRRIGTLGSMLARSARVTEKRLRSVTGRVETSPAPSPTTVEPTSKGDVMPSELREHNE